jgi:type I restriction enzyme R subunit
MTFTEANTVEAHLRGLLTGAASARPAQLSVRLARADWQSSRWGQV